MAIERASATDRAFLAMDGGSVPEQIAVVLRLDPGTLDPARVRELVGARIRAVPRLRQRLVRTPLGCGGPIWVDDADFDVRRHVVERVCHAPGDERGLLDTATAVVMTRLAQSAPLWSVTVVTGLDDGGVALIVVLHHVLADGVGALAVLTALTDDPDARRDDPDAGRADLDVAAGTPFPRPAPSAVDLARDAWRTRARVDLLPGSWRLLRRTVSAGGGLRPAKAARCSLNRRTGPRRAVAVVTADRSRLREAARRAGATTNDAVLVAVTDALEDVLRLRGESVDPLVVTVPVSGRSPAPAQGTASAPGTAVPGTAPAPGTAVPGTAPAPGTAAAGTALDRGARSLDGQLGNLVSPLLVDVPTSGPVRERLARVGARVRTGRSAAVGPPPIASLGWLFRPLARAGGFRLYMNHQHRFHTLISHLRGPDHPVTFGGHVIRSAIPLAVSDSGNQTVYFEVLSYAGTLAITAIADPDHFGELDRFAELLRGHLERIVDAVPGPDAG